MRAAPRPTWCKIDEPASSTGMSSAIAPKSHGRARDGCWTCRQRKKKCDSTTWPCGACVRLGLPCDRGVRLVWEDDGRREGIGRRGPRTGRQRGSKEAPMLPEVQPRDISQRHEAVHLDPRPRAQLTSSELSDNEEQVVRPSADEGNVLPATEDTSGTVVVHTGHETQRFAQQAEPTADSQALLHLVRHFSPSLQVYPRRLEGNELVLLGNYIQRFSRSYPTFAEPTNPFLSVLLPLAMNDSIVMDTLLVLSSAQTGQAVSPSAEREFLYLRQRALRGNRKLLVDDEASSSSRNPPSQSVTLRTVDSLSENSMLSMLASAVMFLLYDKISGETTWQPHLDFIGRLCTSFAQRFPCSPETTESFHFLYNIFLYNDLIRATSLTTSTSSEFYVNIGSIALNHILEEDSRYYFPSLIARISNGDLSVTEADIAAWDGNMCWLPSFALSPSMSFDQTQSSTEQKLLVELYQVAAVIYLRSQQARLLTTTAPQLDDITRLGGLASYGVDLIASIPMGSSVENTLLWPIGIIARQLNMSQVSERAAVLDRLHHLQLCFGMRHYQRVREVLVRDWAMKDAGSDLPTGRGPTMILLG